MEQWLHENDYMKWLHENDYMKWLHENDYMKWLHENGYMKWLHEMRSWNNEQWINTKIWTHEIKSWSFYKDSLYWDSYNKLTTETKSLNQFKEIGLNEMNQITIAINWTHEDDHFRRMRWI